MYRVFQFGSVALPPAMPEDDLSTGQAESTLVDSVGGVYDAWGTRRRLPRRQVINLRGMYDLYDSGRFADGQPIYLIDHAGNHIIDHAGNRIIADSGAISIRRNVDLLKRQEGTIQALYRRREEDSLIEWKMARLLKVGYTRTLEDAGGVARMEMAFETRQAGWRKNTATTVSAALPATLNTFNGGDLTVADAILTITATTSITSIVITGTGIDLTWTATPGFPLSAGNSFILNGSNQTITNGGLDAYTLTRGAGHTVAGWLALATGYNTIQVSANGSGTATLTYNEQRL